MISQSIVAYQHFGISEEIRLLGAARAWRCFCSLQSYSVNPTTTKLNENVPSYFLAEFDKIIFALFLAKDELAGREPQQITSNWLSTIGIIPSHLARLMSFSPFEAETVPILELFTVKKLRNIRIDSMAVSQLALVVGALKVTGHLTNNSNLIIQLKENATELLESAGFNPEQIEKIKQDPSIRHACRVLTC